MDDAMNAYMAGDRVPSSEPGASLRYIGSSRSLGSELAVDVNSGALWSVNPARKLSGRVDPVPSQPEPGTTKALPGRKAWIEWATACFKAVPSLGAEDRVTDRDEKDAPA